MYYRVYAFNVLGTLAALSAMVNLEIPHVNVMSKMDLIQGPDKELVEKWVNSPEHWKWLKIEITKTNTHLNIG